MPTRQLVQEDSPAGDRIGRENVYILLEEKVIDLGFITEPNATKYPG
jgi:hypothetical protein